MKRPEKEELLKYHAFYDKDTKFASHARLLQSKWREKNNHPMNDQPRSNYGNFLETKYAKTKKVNFLTENIKKLVSEKILEIRKNGGLIGEPRIWNNLLSSQPLCFNLFGEMHYDLDLASKFFKKLFPDKVAKVTKVDFEFSSKRNDPDNSAFDVYIEYTSIEGENCFFGIEVKYQERLTEESKAKALKNFERHELVYTKLTRDSNFFKLEEFEKLREVPYGQIWRDHLLSFNMSDGNRSGSFIYLYPFENESCHQAVNNYLNLLSSEDEAENKFHQRDLAVFIRVLNELHNVDWTEELLERYLGE